MYLFLFHYPLTGQESLERNPRDRVQVLTLYRFNLVATVFPKLGKANRYRIPKISVGRNGYR